MTLRVHTLGGLKIVRNGAEVEALPGQTLRCALFLHVVVERRASRESLVGLLWPDRGPERARHSLSQTLYELRRLLGEACIETTGDVLRCGEAVEAVDAHDFRAAAERGERSAALALYRGRFLDGARLAPTREFESWTDRVRSRLHRLHRKLRSEEIAACLEAGRREEALAAARTWVELDPLEDEAHHHLIRLLVESGRRSEGLRQFERYRDLLDRELELEPLDEVRELVDRVRAGETAPASDVPAPGGAREEEAADRPRPEAAGDAASSAGDARENAAGDDVAVERPTPVRDRVYARPEGGETSAPADPLGAAMRARLPRVLAVYLVASLAVLQFVDILIERLGLTDAFFGAALVVLVAGLPVVVTTALIQAGVTLEALGARVELRRRSRRAAARWFTWRNATLGGLAAAVVWTAYALLAAPPGSVEAVAPEAEVIAVLPFTVSGAGLDDFGEGIVSLLGPNLNGVGEIRTVNPRTVVPLWDARSGDGEPDLEEALEIGREVGAGSVLLGSVVAAGERVRLGAELHALGGTRLARADAEGPLTDVFSLVDSLTVRLVREVWRSREPLPDLRVSAVTTGSLPAMRAFFRGEELYRRSRWSEAGEAFHRAVELDSTFALAHLRLVDSEFWEHRSFTPDARRAMESAYRLRDRLPPRDRTLVVARRLDLDGHLAALDTMAAYVERHPEDGEGWYYLGDVRFHARKLRPAEPDLLYRPFERSMSLLPAFGPAVIHPLQWSLVTRDSARFATYLARLRGFSPEGRGEPFSTWGRLAWGPPDSIGVYLDRSLAGATPSGWPPLLMTALSRPDVDPAVLVDAVGRRIEEMSEDDPGWQRAHEQRARLLAGLGRFEAFGAAIERLGAIDPARSAHLALRPVVAGVAPPAVAERALEGLEVPTRADRTALRRGLLDLATGQVDRGRSRLAVAAADAEDGRIAHLLAAAGGWGEILAGDTLSGLGRLERGLVRAGYLESGETAALRYVWARTLVARPETRAEGIRRLRHADPDLELVGAHRLLLARALDDAGARDAAARNYRDLLRLWADADPRLAEETDGARRRLGFLGPSP